MKPRSALPLPPAGKPAIFPWSIYLAESGHDYAGHKCRWTNCCGQVTAALLL